MAAFGQVNARLVGPDAPRILPWMLDGASEQIIATILAPLPEPARMAYQNEWQPAYAALDRWVRESRADGWRGHRHRARAGQT